MSNTRRIQFGLDEYTALNGGVYLSGEDLVVTLIANDIDLADVEVTLSDISNTQRIVILEDEGEGELESFSGYTQLKKICKEKNVLVDTRTEITSETKTRTVTRDIVTTEVVAPDYVIDYENDPYITLVEEIFDLEGINVTGLRITRTTPTEVEEEYTINHATPINEYADVIIATLGPTSLTQRVDQNTADIEYIAIMSDIDLEEV